MKKLWCVAAVVMACGVAQGGTAGVVYVDDDAKVGGDGTSWATAYRSLQDALAAVRAAGVTAEVRVAQGVYKPDDGAGLTAGDRELSFALDVAVTVRGGYAGVGAADPDARDVKGFVTTLSGDLAGDDAPGFLNRSENTKRVVVISAASGEAVLEGVVVRGGENGGLRVPGGVHVVSGASLLLDCLVTDNRGMLGGGIGVDDGTNFTMKQCWVYANRATFAGGGLGFNGAGQGCTGLAESCRFSRNEAPQAGGLLASGASSMNWKLLNCVIDRNMAVSHSSWAAGGGLIWNSTYAPLVNCVIYENSAPEGTGGGLVDLSSGGSHCHNCVFWANNDSEGRGRSSHMQGNSSTFVGRTINCVEGVLTPIEFGGESGSSDSYFVPGDPMFADPDGADNIGGNTDDDFRLRPGSPLIDAGIIRTPNFPLPTDGEDYEGLTRVVDDPTRVNSPAFPASVGPIDVGAYEFQYDCNGNGSVDTEDLLSLALDCDDNGVLDACETVSDCNSNGVNDRCEIAAGVEQDCNGNGFPDSCDIGGGVSADTNSDGVPDECQKLVVRVAPDETLMHAGALAWTDSVPDLHAALAIAGARSGPTEIWIAEGVYKPDGPGGRRNATFQVPANTAIYGGFAGTELTRDERDLNDGDTVLSGDLNGDDDPTVTITGNPTPADRDDNSITIMRPRFPGANVVLDRLVFENGVADGPPAAAPLFAYPQGGGMLTSGGGVKVGLGTEVVVLDCEFRRCWNGGFASSAGSDVVERCWFHDNAGAGAGAALSSGASTFNDCLFESNRSFVTGGGAVHVLDSTGVASCLFQRCQFLRNSSTGLGGAVRAHATQGLVFINCLFAGNISEAGSGGGISFYQGFTLPAAARAINVHSCTFLGNHTQGTVGGALARTSSIPLANVRLSNNIFFHNTAVGAASTLLAQTNAFSETESGMTANCIQGLTNGLFGNVGFDPMLVDADGPDDVYGTDDDDIRLMPGSPCIDAGNNTVLPEVIQAPVMTDLLGGARFVDDPSTPDTGVGVAPIIDIGAIEFVPPPACPGDVNGDGLTDGRDLSVFLFGFGLSVAPGSGADVNGDGLVDGRDLSVFLANFGCGG